MRRPLSIVIVVALAMFAYHRTRKHQPVEAVPVSDQQVERDDSRLAASDQPVERDEPRLAASDDSGFHCDGRTHCSQMSSCAEATYFLEHCPGTKMDGDQDGIPCEDQHCGH